MIDLIMKIKRMWKRIWKKVVGEKTEKTWEEDQLAKLRKLRSKLLL
jgi:hypothetical protein